MLLDKNESLFQSVAAASLAQHTLPSTPASPVSGRRRLSAHGSFTLSRKAGGDRCSTLSVFCRPPRTPSPSSFLPSALAFGVLIWTDLSTEILFSSFSGFCRGIRQEAMRGRQEGEVRVFILLSPAFQISLSQLAPSPENATPAQLPFCDALPMGSGSSFLPLQVQEWQKLPVLIAWPSVLHAPLSSSLTFIIIM